VNYNPGEKKRLQAICFGAFQRFLVLRLIKCVTSAAKDVLDFVPDEVFDFGAGRAEVFTGVKFFRTFRDYFPYGRRHGEAQVGVNVYLGATSAARDFNVGLGHTLGIGHFTPVFVDFLDQVFRHARRAVQYEWIIAETGVHERLFDGFEPFQIQMLLAFKFVGAMRVADGHGERVAAGFLDKSHRFVRVRVMAGFRVGAASFTFIELRAHEVAEFGFHHAIVFVRVLHDLFCDFNVFLERLVARVNHHAGKPFINAILAQLERVAVVEMHRNRDGGQADSRLDEFLKINRIGVLARALGNLEDQRRLFLLARLDDGLNELHVVDVERAESVFALQRLRKKFSGVCQWHNSFLIG